MEFYYKDQSVLKTEMQLMVVGQSEVVKIINKLCRRFKLSKLRVTFTKRRPGAGTYYYPKRSYGLVSDYRCSINLHKEVFSIGTIIHEMGHHMDFIKNGSPKNRKWHTNKLLVNMRRITRYCKKMRYWGWVEERE